jgi:hypothetical protein
MKIGENLTYASMVDINTESAGASVVILSKILLCSLLPFLAGTLSRPSTYVVLLHHAKYYLKIYTY